MTSYSFASPAKGSKPLYALLPRCFAPMEAPLPKCCHLPVGDQASDTRKVLTAVENGGRGGRKWWRSVVSISPESVGVSRLV